MIIYGKSGKGKVTWDNQYKRIYSIKELITDSPYKTRDKIFKWYDPKVDDRLFILLFILFNLISLLGWLVDNGYILK